MKIIRVEKKKNQNGYLSNDYLRLEEKLGQNDVLEQSYFDLSKKKESVKH
jgi:hypothetical protein